MHERIELPYRSRVKQSYSLYRQERRRLSFLGLQVIQLRRLEPISLYGLLLVFGAQSSIMLLLLLTNMHLVVVLSSEPCRC